MKQLHQWPLRIATAALVLTVGACATGGGAPTNTGSGEISAGPGVDVENKTITIGYITALSGPVAALGEPIHAGLTSYWDAVNDRGGIDGWKVKLLVKDNSYETTQHVQLFNEIKDDIALLNSFGSPTTKAIQPLISREQIVTVPVGWDSLWGADPHMAPVGTPFSIDMANGLDYVTEGGKKKPKIGIIYQDDEAGADFLRGYDAAKKAYGFDDVGRLPYKVGDTDFTAQVQRLRSADAEVVVVGGVPSASGPIVGTAASLGYHPQWLFMGPAFLERLITEDGTADGKKTPLADPLDGTLVTMFAAAWGDTDAPGMEQMLEDQKRYAPKQTPSVYFTVGYTQGKLQEAILRKAIEDGDLTREGILEAKLTLGHVDLGGLAPDVNYSRELGPPSRRSLIQMIDPDEPGFLKTVQTNHRGEAAERIKIG